MGWVFLRSVMVKDGGINVFVYLLIFIYSRIGEVERSGEFCSIYELLRVLDGKKIYRLRGWLLLFWRREN